MASELSRLLSHLKGEITKAKKSGWTFPDNQLSLEELLNSVNTTNRSAKDIVEDVRNLAFENAVAPYSANIKTGEVLVGRKAYKEFKKLQRKAKREIEKAIRKGETPDQFYYEVLGGRKFNRESYDREIWNEVYEKPFGVEYPSRASQILSNFRERLTGMDYEYNSKGEWRPSIQRGHNTTEAQGRFVEAVDVLMDIMDSSDINDQYLIDHEEEISNALDQLDADRYDYQIQATFSNLARILNGGKDLNENMNEALTQAVSNDVGYMPVE